MHNPKLPNIQMVLLPTVSLNFLRELFVEMLWAFWQMVVDTLFEIN